MMFSGLLPVASGVNPSPARNLKSISYAIVKECQKPVSAFVIAERKTRLGHEWQLFVFSLLRLHRKEARYQHVLYRRLEGFRFSVICTNVDHLDRPFLEPRIPYLSFLAKLKPKRFSMKKSAAPI